MNKTEAMIEISGDMGDFVAPAHSPHDVDPSNRNGQFITDTEVVSAIGLRCRSRGHLLTSFSRWADDLQRTDSATAALFRSPGGQCPSVARRGHWLLIAIVASITI